MSVVILRTSKEAFHLQHYRILQRKLLLPLKILKVLVCLGRTCILYPTWAMGRWESSCSPGKSLGNKPIFERSPTQFGNQPASTNFSNFKLTPINGMWNQFSGLQQHTMFFNWTEHNRSEYTTWRKRKNCFMKLLLLVCVHEHLHRHTRS